MSQILCIVVSFALIWPVAYHGLSTGGKPVDFVASDLIPLLLAFSFTSGFAFRDRCSLQLQTSYRLACFWCALFAVGCLTVALFGYAASGEAVRLASAVKFVKPVSFFLVGHILARSLDTGQFLRTLPRACLVLALSSGVSTVLAPGFPNGAWGKHLFGFELYGYPNSPMSFYASLIPFLLAGSKFDTYLRLRPLYLIAACALFTVIVGSMSRSSTGIAIFGVLAFWCLTRNTRALTAVAVAVICVAVFGVSVEHLAQEHDAVASLKERVEIRLDRTVDSDDALSGRGEIWVETIHLVAMSPLFGYCFEPFSNYAFHSTPHQQYLEILFKAGVFGFSIFLIFFLYSGALAIQLLRRFASDAVMGPAIAAIGASLLAVCLGNMTQPNFTYSVTGNFQFFLLGLLLSESTILMAARTHTPVPAGPAHRQFNGPVRLENEGGAGWASLGT